MTFREAIGAEPLDLLEAAFGEVALIAAPHHPLHQPLAVALDRAGVAKARHRPAQAVRLGGGESRRRDRDLHRLFLEQGHAEGSAQHLLQLIRISTRRSGEIRRLLALPPPQVWVHHIPLDRPRPDNRHLDHQIIEGAGAEPWQHVHLRPALDLEHADGVRLAQHVVDLRIIRRDLRQIRDADQVKRLANAGQHAQRQHIDLHQAQRVDIVLVPLDESSIDHRPLHHRNRFVEPPLRQDEAADVLRQMPWKADQLAGKRHSLRDQGIVRIKPRLADMRLRHAGAPAAPDHARQRAGHVLRQAEHLAHLTDGAAGTVVDDRGAQGGAVTTITLIDVLDHLLAPLVLEIHVDIRRLIPLAGDEAGEQEIVLGRVHRCDAEAKADRAVRRRAPPLAQYALRPRELDHIVHGQKVRGIVLLRDQLEFGSQGI